MLNLSYVLRAAVLTLLLACQSAFALPEGAINVNAASPEEIATALKGVGYSRAAAIVKYREQHGDFVDMDEFLAVKGIGPSVVKNNEGKIFFADD